MSKRGCGTREDADVLTLGIGQASAWAEALFL